MCEHTSLRSHGTYKDGDSRGLRAGEQNVCMCVGEMKPRFIFLSGETMKHQIRTLESGMNRREAHPATRSSPLYPTPPLLITVYFGGVRGHHQKEERSRKQNAVSGSSPIVCGGGWGSNVGTSSSEEGMRPKLT